MFLIDWPGGSWEATAKLAAAIILIYIAAIWLSLVFWTYRDIRQRTRDPILQALALLLPTLFFLPGFWIYQLLRPRYTLAELYERSLEEEALLQDLEEQKSCPTCKRRVLDDYLICPSCRTHLKEPCRSCAKPLSYAWVACPFCGLEKPAREARPAARQPQRGQPMPAQAQPVQAQQPQPGRPQAAATQRPQPVAPPPQQQRPQQPPPQAAPQPQPIQPVRASGSRIPFGPPPGGPAPSQRTAAPIDEPGIIDAT